MTTPNDDTRNAGAAEPCSVPGPTPAEISQANAERRRNGLVRFLERHHITPTELARMIDLPSPNAIYNFVAGRSASLNTETLERILASFPAETFDALIGRPTRAAKRPEPGDRRPNTSKPALGHKVSPYLLRNLAVTRPNQSSAMDITYNPIARSFVYLAAVVDWFSDARTSIASYLGIYNAKRPHSSLDQRTPDQACFTSLPHTATA